MIEILIRLSFITWIFPIMQVESILLATFTELPQISYCGLFAPMTPATTGPILIPGNHNKLNPKIMSLVSPTKCIQTIDFSSL